MPTTLTPFLTGLIQDAKAGGTKWKQYQNQYDWDSLMSQYEAQQKAVDTSKPPVKIPDVVIDNKPKDTSLSTGTGTGTGTITPKTDLSSLNEFTYKPFEYPVFTPPPAYVAPPAPTYAPAPAAYVSPYDARINAALDKILGFDNNAPYDVTKDPLYDPMKQEYEKAGQSAFNNQIGRLSAMTGGRPSTAAVGTATGAQNEYAQEFSGKVLPSLVQANYQRQQDAFGNMLNQLKALQGVDESGYGRYRDTVGDWKDNRNFTRDVYESDRDYGRGVYESDRNFGRDVYDADRNYARGAYEYDKTFGYNTYRDKIADTGMLPNGTYTQTGTKNKLDIERMTAENKDYIDPNSYTNKMKALGLKTAEINLNILDKTQQAEIDGVLADLEGKKIDNATAQAQLKEITDKNSLTNRLKRVQVDTAELNLKYLEPQLQAEAESILLDIENKKINVATGQAELKELTDPNSITNQMKQIGLDTARINYAILDKTQQAEIDSVLEELKGRKINNELAQKQLDEITDPHSITNQLKKYELDTAQLQYRILDKTQQAQIDGILVDLQNKKIDKETAQYQLDEIKNPNSFTNRLKAAQVKNAELEADLNAKWMPEEQKLKIQQLKKTIDQIGKATPMTEKEKEYYGLQIKKAEADLEQTQWENGNLKAGLNKDGTPKKTDTSTTFTVDDYSSIIKTRFVTPARNESGIYYPQEVDYDGINNYLNSLVESASPENKDKVTKMTDELARIWGLQIN